MVHDGVVEGTPPAKNPMHLLISSHKGSADPNLYFQVLHVSKGNETLQNEFDAIA